MVPKVPSSVPVAFRVTPAELEHLRFLARTQGLSLPEFVRRAVFVAAGMEGEVRKSRGRRPKK